MIRKIGLTVGGLATSLAVLAGCGDGRGSPYSSERAQRSSVSYIPVTPGAVPVMEPQVLTGPIAVTPGAVPVPIETASAGAVTTTALAPAAPAPVVRFSTGPIYSACLDAQRAGATPARCGCVQWVADRHLTADQQRRGAGYFIDQHELQEVRQSGGGSDAAFWDAWKAFGTAAGEMCRDT